MGVSKAPCPIYLCVLTVFLMNQHTPSLQTIGKKTIQNIALTFEHTVLAMHICFFSGNSFIHLFIET